MEEEAEQEGPGKKVEGPGEEGRRTREEGRQGAGRTEWESGEQGRCRVLLLSVTVLSGGLSTSAFWLSWKVCALKHQGGRRAAAQGPLQEEIPLRLSDNSQHSS